MSELYITSLPFDLERPKVLEEQLTDIHDAGFGINKILHHRKGRDFTADVIYQQAEALPAGRFVCEVGLLDDPAAFAGQLNALQERGVQICEILQHRVQNEMRAAIIGFLPETI